MQNESSSTSMCTTPMSTSTGPSPDIVASVSALLSATSNPSGGFVFRTPPLLRGDLLPPAEELCRLLQHRRGKGGRQPASDPRLDPRIDAKKAKRILANRQSAARSKMKQKAFMDGLRAQQTLLKYQKDAVARELGQLAVMCKQLDDENNAMLAKIQAVSNQYRIQNVLFNKLCEQRNQLLSDAIQSTAAGAAAADPSPAATATTATALFLAPTLCPTPQATMAPPSLLPPATPEQPAAAAAAWPGLLEAAAAQSTIAAALHKAALCAGPAAVTSGPQVAPSNPALWQALNGGPATAAAAAPAAPMPAAAAAPADVPQQQPPAAAVAEVVQAAAEGAPPAAGKATEGSGSTEAASAGQAAVAAAAAAAAAQAAAGGPGAMQRSCNQLLPAHLGGQRMALPCA